VRLLVFGGWGQLGSDLAAVAAGRHEVIRPRHAEVDVTDEVAVQRVIEDAVPDVVMNAAAFHVVEACEREPARAFAVNAVGASNVARASAAAHARHVFVSSDYVFDGSNERGYLEDDRPRPVNVYGVSKAAGERLVANACPDALVVRGSGMFGHAGSSGKGGNFVETMLAKAAADEPAEVVDDLRLSPTSTHDMAERLVQLLERGAPAGIYHLANVGACSWFEFARTIFELAGAQVQVTPRRYPVGDVPRPRCSVLLDARTAELGLPPGRPWQEAVRWYLETRRLPIG
jgi:dTDP-4-dehydrorhamnose reductase